MLQNGKYSVWFRTPQGEGTGVVALEDGRITGGDTILDYEGSYDQAGDAFNAEIATRRHTPGHSSVFGVDDIELRLTGKSTPTTASCHGTSLQPPGMIFEATMIRIAE